MANVVRDPREHPDAIIPNLSTNNIARFTVDDVALVYGSKWKQRTSPSLATITTLCLCSGMSEPRNG